MSGKYLAHWMASVCLGLVVIGFFVSPRVDLAAETNDSVNVDKLVNDLGSPDAEVRTAANVSLYMLPTTAFDALEAAAKRDDLNPEASMRLKTALSRIRPWIAPRRRREAEDVAMTEYLRRSCLEAYDSVGKKDKKWDDIVHDGISRFFSDRTKQYTARRRFDFVISKGCDDPLVLYLDIQLMPRDSPAELEAIDPLFRKAEEKLEKSQYPPERKMYAMLRYFRSRRDFEWHRPKAATDEQREDAKQVLERMLDGARKLWPEVCARPGIPKKVLFELGDELVQAFYGDKADLGNLIHDLELPLLKVLPNDSMPLLLKGRAYINWAWQARGEGLANTVTPEGWKLLHDRLELAKGELSKSWELDHDNAAAATQMISVILGEDGDRGAMELWFKRAMSADPDSKVACTSKLGFLEPKWHGNAEEMLAFGRECRDGQNWYAGLPFILIDAHESLAGYAANPDDYFKDEQVWRDIESVYSPYMTTRPNNVIRNRYAYYACRCGKWAEARQQFHLLGKTALPASFGGSAAMQHFKELAEANGRSPTP